MAFPSARHVSLTTNVTTQTPCRAVKGCQAARPQQRRHRSLLQLRSASSDNTITYSFDETTNSAAPSSSFKATAATATTSSSFTSSSSNGSNGRSNGSSTSSSVQATVLSTKLALLERVAGLDRGALASPTDRSEVERLVAALEAVAGPAGADRALAGSPAPVEGRWELLYTNKETFRASPFFLAFQDGLVRDKQLAEAIFAFTDAIPGAHIRGAYQTVSLLSGSLISEVDMEVWPGLTGTVVTSSRAALPPGGDESSNSLELAVESTRVTGSTFSPFLDSVSVPVEALMAAVRGEGATRAAYTFTYVDSNLRITRAGDQLLLHRRVL